MQHWPPNVAANSAFLMSQSIAPPAANDGPPLRFGFTALLIGNIAISLGPLFIRAADTGPVAAGFWRLALAVPFLFLIARGIGQPAAKLDRRLTGLLLFSGVCFAADLAAWHLGVLQTKMANSNLFGNSTSFLLPLYAFVVARHWPTRLQGFALALAGIGTVLLLGSSFELSPSNFVGDLLCILAGAFYTIYLIVMERARNDLAAMPTLAWSTLMSAPPMLLIALAMGENIIPVDWTPMLGLAFFSQILGQSLMIYAIGRVPALLFGITLLIQPMVSALIGWWRFGEVLSPTDLTGALLIAVALLLVRRNA